VWASAVSGTVLCSETTFSDQFAFSASDIAGRSFSALGTDPGALGGLVEAGSTLSPEELRDLKITTKLMHRCAAAVCVGITTQEGLGLMRPRVR